MWPISIASLNVYKHTEELTPNKTNKYSRDKVYSEIYSRFSVISAQRHDNRRRHKARRALSFSMFPKVMKWTYSYIVVMWWWMDICVCIDDRSLEVYANRTHDDFKHKVWSRWRDFWSVVRSTCIEGVRFGNAYMSLSINEISEFPRNMWDPFAKDCRYSKRTYWRFIILSCKYYAIFFFFFS